GGPPGDELTIGLISSPRRTGRASLPTRPSSSVDAGVFARTGAEQPCGFEHRKRSGKACSGRDRRASSPGRDETNAQRDERCPSSAQDYESRRSRSPDQQQHLVPALEQGFCLRDVLYRGAVDLQYDVARLQPSLVRRAAALDARNDDAARFLRVHFQTLAQRVSEG